jgi:hypothetical protein
MLNFEVMDKCLGFSTTSLLITILGVLCNLTVLAAISQNPQGLWHMITFHSLLPTLSFVVYIHGV